MPDLDRRALSRALSHAADASVADILAGWTSPPCIGARRIAVTGAPGTGKSTLTGQLGSVRVSDDRQVGVIAIDPSSPYSGGAILGDRIRMDSLSCDARLFIRSLASRNASEGLADNLLGILQVMERFGFDEVILETVGVGQADCAVRDLVDTVVLVLMPEFGDKIQAMKSGLMEAADIYVVNKADLPGAANAVAALGSIIERSRGNGWQPPVIQTSVRQPDTIKVLSEAIDQHLLWRSTHVDSVSLQRRRTQHQLQGLFKREISQALSGVLADRLDRPLPELFRDLALRLAANGGAGPEDSRSMNSVAKEE